MLFIDEILSNCTTIEMIVAMNFGEHMCSCNSKISFFPKLFKIKDLSEGKRSLSSCTFTFLCKHEGLF